MDDDADSRELYAACLADFEVLHAENGAAGVQAAIDSRPHLIVMDLQMPVMDGLEAIASLRQDARTRSIPIAVLSGNDAVEHEKAKVAGCARCLVKPCSLSVFVDVVRTLLDASEVGES